MKTGLPGDVGLSQETNGAEQDTFNMAFYGGHWAFYRPVRLEAAL